MKCRCDAAKWSAGCLLEWRRGGPCSWSIVFLAVAAFAPRAVRAEAPSWLRPVSPNGGHPQLHRGPDHRRSAASSELAATDKQRAVQYRRLESVEDVSVADGSVEQAELLKEGVLPGMQRGYHSQISSPRMRALQEEDDQLTELRCSQSPGFAPDKPLVGYRANNYLDMHGRLPGRVLADDKDQPLLLTSGCKFHYFMLKGDLIHVAVVKHEREHMLTVDWDQQGMFAVALLSWSQHGAPFAMPGLWSWIYGLTSRWDDYIWSRSLTGDKSYHIHRSSEDFFHCKPGCFEFQQQEHAGSQTGRLLVTLDTHFEGDSLTQLTGHYRFDFHPRPTPLRHDQFNALRDLYMAACAENRNGTDPGKPFETWWDWTLHQKTVHRDPDLKPYCDWLMSTGWRPEWEGMLESDTDIYDHSEDGVCAEVDEVTCDRDGYIKGIHLNAAGLKGTLPKSLANLTRMKDLDLPYNQLRGSLPQHLLEHGSLQNLVLYHNFFTGTLPCFLGEPLRRVEIGWNEFEGSFPNCLGKLTDMRVFEAYHVNLRGAIPDEFRSLTNLRRFGVGSNQLQGRFPDFLCDAEYLETLDISSNEFEGPFPAACLSKPRHLHVLHADYNRFTGELPPVSEALLDLEVLDLGHNFFTGDLGNQMDSIMAMTKSSLHSIYLNDNLLSGSLHSHLNDTSGDPQKRLQMLLQDNYFRCENTGRWPSWAERLDKVELGVCVPVPRPMSLSPEWGSSGTRISIRGADFLRTPFPMCRFSSTPAGGDTYDVSAVRQSGAEVACNVPAALEPGTYGVTVSNFDQDFASEDTIQGYKRLEFLVTKSPPRDFGAYVHADLMMAGKVPTVTVQGFHEPAFQEGFAAILGAQPENVIVHGPTNSICVARLDLPGASCVELSVSILAASFDMAQSYIDTLSEYKVVSRAIEKLSSFHNKGIDVESMVIDALYVGGTFEEGEQDKGGLSVGAIIAICVLVAAILVIAALIACLIRREKLGRPYFQDHMDDIRPAHLISGGRSVAMPARLGHGYEGVPIEALAELDDIED